MSHLLQILSLTNLLIIINQKMRKMNLRHRLKQRKKQYQDQKISQNQSFFFVRQPPLTQYYEVNQNLKYLQGLVGKYYKRKKSQPPSFQIILEKYIQYYYQYYEYDRFDPFYISLPFNNLDTAVSEQQIYKSINIFERGRWPVRFHAKFIQKITKYKDYQIIYILTYIMRLSFGFFHNNQSPYSKKKREDMKCAEPISTPPMTLNRFFYITVFRQINILFNTGVQKMPILKDKLVKKHQFINYIYILDIINNDILLYPSKLAQCAETFQKQMQKDVRRKDHGEQLIPEFYYTTNRQFFLFQYESNPKSGEKKIIENEIELQCYKPIKFKPYELSMSGQSTIFFDKNLRKWVDSSHLQNQQEKKVYQLQKKVNQEMIKRFVDFQSAKNLVQLLTKIPNFRVQLTDEQKEVIGQNGNVIVIGRSGTGKTTCAVLRLFAIQMLFKIRMSLYKKKYQQQMIQNRCTGDDIDQTLGLRCVFLTASPVLTNQMEIYYKKLKDNIKKQLQKKKKKVLEEKKEKEQEALKMTKIIQKQEEGVQKTDCQQEQIQDVTQKLEIKRSKQAIQEQQEMRAELKDIDLEQKIQNTDFSQNQQNDDGMRDQIEQKMNKFKSLYDLKQEDYPGFFTIRSFIMMVDGCLTKPFFVRKDQNNQPQSQVSWHNEKKGIMMIQNYFKGQGEGNKQIPEEQIDGQINYDDEEQIQYEYLKKVKLKQNQNLAAKTNKKIVLSFEVDYEYFCSHFWPNVKRKSYSMRIITPNLVWTQIFSVIKGSSNSHLFPGLYLSKDSYFSQYSNQFLRSEVKDVIYSIFQEYESWKIKGKGYDIMDAVNYILNFIRFRGYTGPEIHYLMIDQIQDLPHATIYLLSKTVKYGAFYSGDTAQTIAKGVGFRFSDLKGLFNANYINKSTPMNKPIVKQLTVNFRSHNNILQLANSIVSCLQVLFPKTIDKLKKQTSNLLGPKPMILAEKDQQLLFYVLCGGEQKQKKTSIEGLKKPSVQFGCNQVILVRDQESKNKIPAILEHALCLTIYQAKGLQFNDVILFNFFTDSKCTERWDVINFLKVETIELDIQEYEKQVTNRIQKQTEKNYQLFQEVPWIVEDDVECIMQNKQGRIHVKKLVCDPKIKFRNLNDYGELCSQLKMLYTAITRPRNTLIIYDEDPTARRTIQKVWQKLQVVSLVNRQFLQKSKKENTIQSELKIFTPASSIDSAEWKKQGLKMYSRGYFQSAMKCFLRSGDHQLYRKMFASNLANNATKKLINISSQKSEIQNKIGQYQNISPQQLSKIKKRHKKQSLNAFEKFLEAAQIFQCLSMNKQAAQCYFSGKNYEKAFENFKKTSMNKQCAESLQMMSKYKQAAEYYRKEGSYLKVIECLDFVNQWEQILLAIKQFQNKMSQVEKKTFYKKYSALALQQLIYEIQFENQPQQSRSQNKPVQIIKEQSEDQEEEDEEGELQVDQIDKRQQKSLIPTQVVKSLKSGQKEQNIMLKSQTIQMEGPIKESMYQNINGECEKVLQSFQLNQSSFCDLNQQSQISPNYIKQGKLENAVATFSQQKEERKVKNIQKEKLNQSSFGNLNQSDSSFADLNSQTQINSCNDKYPPQLQPDIQSVKSMVQSQNLWLQSDLSQIGPKTNTQYSIIDQKQQESYNYNARIIRTKGNIVVQDEVMRKIISIVALVNQSVQQFLKQFKGYQSLITVAKKSQDINKPQMSEFQDIQPQFINLILDTLQSLKLYKLCLFVCNRYYFPQKTGRYLLSILLKYSTNAQTNNLLKPALIVPTLARKLSLQKGILASITSHAVFQNVSPEYLKVTVEEGDKQQSKKSLGLYFIEGIILEGLYKKIVFMLNTQQSLKVLRNFNDRNTYLQLYNKKFMKKPTSQFYSHPPTTPQEQQYTITKLQQILFHHNLKIKTKTISQRYYRQFNTEYIKNLINPSSMSEYTPLLKAFINFQLSGSSFEVNYKSIFQALNLQLRRFMSYLEIGPNYKLYEIVSFITIIINNPNMYQYISELPPTQFLQFLNCLRTVRKALKKQYLTKSLQITQAVMSIYCCRIIEPCKSTKFINDGYSLVYRASILCNQFIKEIKKNKQQTAFFFQQDYNYVIVKTVKLIQIVSNKFDIAYCKFVKYRLEAKIRWFEELNNKFMWNDFQYQQSQYLIRAMLRQQIRQFSVKNKKKWYNQVKTLKRQQKPQFCIKLQGSPELTFFQETQLDSSEQKYIYCDKVDNLFIFPNVNSEFKNFSDIFISAFYNKLKQAHGRFISGRLLYSPGLNDIYKQYSINHPNHLYDAVQFRKFHRLDLYAENILEMIKELSYTQRHLFSAEILINLMIQLNCLEKGKNFTLRIPRRFLKFFSGLKLVQILGYEGIPDQFKVNEYLRQNKVACIFTYNNLFSCQLGRSQIIELICQFINVLQKQNDFKCYNIQKLILLLILNIPDDAVLNESLRDFIQDNNFDCNNPLLMEIKGATNSKKFLDRKQKIIKNKELIKNYHIFHQIRVTDISNKEINKNLSEQDYLTQEKIVQEKLKAVNKIAGWWKQVRSRLRSPDQLQLVRQNRLVKISHNLKHLLPLNDNFLVKSAAIRNVLLSFYLKNSISSSLDFHYILMTLNQIQDLRRRYIKIQCQDIVELQQCFEERIRQIEGQIEVWRNDSKWTDDKNLSLKRKKVFQIKWLTRTSVNKGKKNKGSKGFKN